MDIGLDFINVLPSNVKNGDFWWAFKERSALDPSRFSSRDTGFHSSVLNSKPVQDAINDEVLASKRTKEVVSSEAETILAEMGHHYNTRIVQIVAYAVRKIFRRLFSGIYVNRQALLDLPKAYRDPVVLLSTHASYLDFLLISYLCFHLELPLPSVAAASDFKRMSVVNDLLAGCGAFFIQRSCGGYRSLYGAILKEYAKEQLKVGKGCLEFFLEGTRSRTGKHLPPKLGLLSAVVELCLQRLVFSWKSYSVYEILWL